MTRFLLFAFTSLLVLIALFNLGVEVLGQSPELGPLVGWQEGRSGLPGGMVLASWALESLALTALFVLVDGERRNRWLSGLLTGWTAWVFRGPLLVLAAVGFGHLAGGPWWQLSLRWFVLYTLAGLLLALIAGLTAERAEPEVELAAPERRPPEPAPREPTPPEPLAPAPVPPEPEPAPVPPEPEPVPPEPVPPEETT